MQWCDLKCIILLMKPMKISRRVCHSRRRGRTGKIRSTNAYACMIINPASALKIEFIKNYTYLKFIAATTQNKSQYIRVKLLEHGAEKQRKIEVCFPLRYLHLSHFKHSFRSSGCLPPRPPSTHAHTHAYTLSTSRSVTGQGNVQCV